METLLTYWPGVMVYLILINMTAYAAMGIDKSRARQQAWRLPESTLFLLALLGGSIGAIAGMHVFRHKTRHFLFSAGLPLILILQLATTIYLFRV